MADTVVVLGTWNSMFSNRVRIALLEKGVEYEYKEEDLLNKSPLLLESNPIQKKIPVLIHNERPVCESLIIVQYIDETWNKTSPLMPGDPFERANARFWGDFIDKKIYDCGTRILWKSKGEDRDEAKKEFIESLKVLILCGKALIIKGLDSGQEVPHNVKTHDPNPDLNFIASM
ncbi:hypothetical protein AAC387_Pa07g3388 [Persea americana]